MNIIGDFKEAVINNDLSSLKEIVDKYNIELTIENNYALRWASKYNYHDMINFLLDNINDIDYSIKKYILFKSAENNNFELFKRIYNSHYFCLFEEEYNHNNILLTVLDNQVSINTFNKDFICFILDEIGDKINKNYLRDSYEIAFKSCNLDLLDIFFEYKLTDIIKINQPIESFFYNDKLTLSPEISLNFLKILEKYFDLEKSTIRYYTLMIQCVENNLIDSFLYLAQKYNINKIPESSALILLQEILLVEETKLIKYFDLNKILKTETIIKEIFNQLLFNGATDSIIYLIDNLDLKDDIKKYILLNSFKYKSIETISLIIPIIDLDLSFDNLALIKEIFSKWSSLDDFDQYFLNYLLNDDKVYNSISDQWIKENIPKSKRELFLIEYKVRKF
tara:strand:+ start:359 stop:1540 length:1182 start_codon:yes stop_codon:yes gene_type:complete